MSRRYSISSDVSIEDNNPFHFNVTEDSDSCLTEDRGSCFMVTDLVGSTQKWKKDASTMKDNIIYHNFLLRNIINALVCGKGTKNPYDILKINEIGDSWEIIINGPNRFKYIFTICYILLKYYTSDEDRPLIRIGVDCGESMEYEEFFKYDFKEPILLEEPRFIENARELETLADKHIEEGHKSYMFVSKCFFDGLEYPNTDVMFQNPNIHIDIDQVLKKTNEDVNKYKEKTIEKGYIVFLKIKKFNEKRFQELVGFGTILNVQNQGTVYNYYFKDIQGVIELFQYIKTNTKRSLISTDSFKSMKSMKSFKSMKSMKSMGSFKSMKSVGSLIKFPSLKSILRRILSNVDTQNFKMTVAEINETHLAYVIENKPIMETCLVDDIVKQEYIEKQTFKRYISHAQNIAARLFGVTQNGHITANFQLEGSKKDSKELKGLGPTEYWTKS